MYKTSIIFGEGYRLTGWPRTNVDFVRDAMFVHILLMRENEPVVTTPMTKP